jgi:hypothetical protein
MTARLARTAGGWWAVTPAGLVRLDLPAVHPGQTADDVAWLVGRRPGPGRAGRSARACALPSRRNGT